MKPNKQTPAYMLAGAIAFALAGCNSQPVIIEGKVSNLSGNTIVYNATIEGIYQRTHPDSVFVLPDSTYRITLPSKGNEKVSFYIYGQKSLGTVYVGSGKNRLNIDASIEDSLTVGNKLAKENEDIKLLDQLDNDVWDLRARRGDVFQITKDTVATSVYKKLTAYGTALEQKLTGTDGQFKKRAVQDIRMQILLAFMDQYFGIDHKGTEATKKEWAATYSKMLEYAGMEQPENTFSCAFPDVASNMAGIELFMTTKQQPGNRNESHQMVFDWYKKNLKGRVQEAAMAHIILEDDHNERFTTNMPDLYGQFKALHPASALQAPLEAAIQRNLSFNNLELPANIHILNTDSVRSLKEITDRYLGKVIFVDIWATWCGPCRQSFAHVAPLQEYAKKNDIVLLYISIDQPSETGLWKKMAGYYHLKGEHAIVNEAFRTDIYNTFGNKGALYIPHCAIINKKGELQFKTASSPEKMDKLIEQLQEAAGNTAGK